MSRTQRSVSPIRRDRGRATCVAAVLCFLAVGPSPIYSQKRAKPPSFEEYPVAKVHKGAVIPPNFGPLNQYSGTDLRCFGSPPVTYTAMHVNFAGHFVMRTCSCGSGCHYLFLWDAHNGKVYRDLPFPPINVGPYGAGGTTRPVQYAGEQHRADSSLLILDGCFEETCDCARRYYVWSGDQFKLIRRDSARLPPKCQN